MRELEIERLVYIESIIPNTNKYFLFLGLPSMVSDINTMLFSRSDETYLFDNNRDKLIDIKKFIGQKTNTIVGFAEPTNIESLIHYCVDTIIILTDNLGIRDIRKILSMAYIMLPMNGMIVIVCNGSRNKLLYQTTNGMCYQSVRNIIRDIGFNIKVKALQANSLSKKYFITLDMSKHEEISIEDNYIIMGGVK